jgi:hypothetical protein
MENASGNALYIDQAPPKSLRSRLSVPARRVQRAPVAESACGANLADCAGRRAPAARQSPDLAAQAGALRSTIAAMSAAFAAAFATATLARLSAEFARARGRPPLPLDPAPIVAALALEDQPCEEWAALIEAALSASLS